MNKVELVLDCKNSHGEGVFWSSDQGLLYWSDIEGLKLWTFDPKTKSALSYDVAERLCAFALRTDGSILAAFASGLAIYDYKTKRRTDISPFEPSLPHTRFNDGRCDREGRFIVGGMNEHVDAEPTSSVIRVNADLSTSTLINQVSCANSTCFSPDGRVMYFADTPKQIIEAYEYSADDVPLGVKTDLVDCHPRPGVPDGSTVDSQGYIWNAEWDGSCVTRYAPDGTLDQVIELPAQYPTCVALGGKNLDTLFITTSQIMLTPEQTAQATGAGGLYAVMVDVPGVIEPGFAG